MELASLVSSFDKSDIVSGSLSFIIGLGVLAPYVNKIRKVLGGVYKIISTLHIAMEDDKLSSDEVKELVKEARELIDSLKNKKQAKA